ncbi:radical SAM protein [Candidatus Pacearchaeota archaeon]|nr:radical SAM protein [Candidatus Pacearchaeota archaeon]
MKIQSIRLGFATNSSSSHSIIFFNKNKNKIKNDPMYGSFGWESFTLIDLESKMKYLAQNLYSELERRFGKETAKTIIKQLIGNTIISDSDEDSYWEGVDHQSVWSIPYDWEEKGVNIEFIKDLKNFISMENVAILGGNDNDGMHQLIENGYKNINPLFNDWYDHRLVAKKDGKFWVLFNRKTGAKIRFSFDNLEENYIKASTPELVDLKITDYCPYECDFCYQSSSQNGKHAKKKDIYDILYKLSKAKIFEIAIGGGEPTFHPDFDEIVEDIYYNHMIPNFSTKNIKWLKEHPSNHKIWSMLGGVAFSAIKVTDVIDVAEILKSVAKDKYFKNSLKISLQHIVGIVDEYNFKFLLNACKSEGIKLTLLGAKGVGRGCNFKPFKFDWLKIISDFNDENKLPTIAIDTALAAENKDKLDEYNIPEWCYEIKDGKFSCYIDAVERKLGPSSYEQDKLIDWVSEKWIEDYQGF